MRSYFAIFLNFPHRQLCTISVKIKIDEIIIKQKHCNITLSEFLLNTEKFNFFRRTGLKISVSVFGLGSGIFEMMSGGAGLSLW